MAKKKNNDLQNILNGTYKSNLARDNDIAPVKNDTAASKNNLESILDGTYKSNLERTSHKTSSDKEDDGLFKAFNDGYDFGDVTRTLITGGKKLGTAAFNTGKELVTHPGQTIKSFGVGIASGLNKADESINGAVSDFFDWITPGEDKEKKGLSINELNKLISSGTEEEKQEALKKLEEEYGKDSKTYQNYELMLNTEDTRSDTQKKISNIINPKYYNTETYKKAQSGELSEGQENIYGIGENVGNMLPSIAVSGVVSPAVGSSLFFVQSQQSYTEEAKERGYSDKEARSYGFIMGGAEVLVERLGFDELGGLKKLSSASIKKAMVGEGLEEFVMPYIDSTVKSIGYGEEFDLAGTTEEALEGAVMGATVGAIMNAGGRGLTKVDSFIEKVNTGQEITQNDIVSAGKELEQNDPNYLKEAMEDVPNVIKEETKKNTEQQNEYTVEGSNEQSIAPVVNQTQNVELNKITNQIQELENQLDTSLNATQQQEILNKINELGQQYNEVSNTITQQEQTNSLVDAPSNTLNNVNTQQNEQLTNNTQVVDNALIDNNNQNNYNVNELEENYGRQTTSQEYKTSTDGQETNEINRGTNGIYEQSSVEQALGENVPKRKFSREEYQQYEKELNNSKTTKLNDNQKNIQNNVKTKSGKDVVFFDGKHLYKGGSSLENGNVIYVSSELNENGQAFVTNHEVMESEIMHNTDFREKYAKDVIEEIINDSNFSKVRESFIGNDTELNNASDYLIAKDILADIYAERETGINKGYEADLSNDTLDFINYTIDRLNEGFNKKVQNNESKVQNETPTQEELDKLEDIRKNKSGSEYARAFYDLEKKYGSANLYKGLNSYKTTGQSLESNVQAKVEEAIAPVKEELNNTLNELKETVSEVKQLAEETKSLTEEDLPMLEQQYKEAPVQDVAPIKENIDNSTAKERYEAISPKANENIDNGGKMIRVSPEMETKSLPSREAFDNAVRKSAMEVENELGYIPQNPTKASSYENLTDTSEETVTNQQIAQILDTEPKTNNQRNKRKWAIFKANVFDKGAVFEDLSLKNKNRDLMGKWDYTLTSEARGQNVIGEGHYESDPVTKERVQTSKSLNDIRTEVDNTGKTKEFYDYIYHKHNVDRMNLSNRFEGMENKPVFGDSVTSEVSQQIVNQYENTNPEFIDYAQDIYNYLNADRQELVKAGVISQETADLWQEMYPHYVPVRRVSDTGLDINVPLDTQRTGINAPIKQATGGSSDILPLFDTMAQRTLQTYRATAKNNFGVELKNTLNSTIDTQQTNVDEVIDSVDNQEGLLQENNGKPTFTVFENGEKVTFSITMDMYDALKPLSDSSILSKTITPLNKMSNFHRGVLTEYNPIFMLTNAIKDAQDVLINSQHATKTYSKIPEAYSQIMKKGYWYQEYVANGGEQNSYFDSQENTFKTENKGLAKLLDLPPLSTISKVNNVIEMSPRLAEYIASREAGRSVEVSMLDAARVTTNFKAGGNLTKFANRNGATFLNASVQGAMQQVRNIREAKMNGLKGWATLAGKFAVAGLPAVILNSLVWDDDDDYDELSDYVKQNYYIVAKKDDGTFIRIPKGRTVAVIQNAIEQIQKASSGDDEADLKGFIDLTLNNLAPNNPIDNNILAPIFQVANNKTWYGGDLVPTRLQDLPAEEQYDESTDMFSRWFGETFNVSPMKVNYLLDQYTGGVGDVVLPMMTPEATSDADTLGEQLLAPLKSKFTTNSTMNNQSISDFYDTKEELTTNAKKKGATDEDVLKNKFFNSVNSEISELYTLKREIQNSDLSNSEKYSQVLEVQKEINELSKAALSDYKDVNISGNYASVGGVQFKLNENEDGETYWNKITDKQITKQKEVSNGLGISASEYWSNKDEYDYAYENPEKYAIATAITDYDTYKEYTSDMWDLKADKDEDGNSISGTKKAKVISYVNSLDLSIPQKAMLIRQQYSTFDEYNDEIVNYVANLNYTYETKKKILEGLKFEVDDDGNVYW